MNGTLFKEVATAEAPTHSYSAHNKELGEFMSLSAIVTLSNQRLLLRVCVFSCGLVCWLFFLLFSFFSDFSVHWIPLRQIRRGILGSSDYCVNKTLHFQCILETFQISFTRTDSVIWAQASHLIVHYIEHMALSCLVTPCAKKEPKISHLLTDISGNQG